MRGGGWGGRRGRLPLRLTGRGRGAGTWAVSVSAVELGPAQVPQPRAGDGEAGHDLAPGARGHERGDGHYWVARKLGFKVLRFSVGLGKPLWKRVGKAPDHVEFVIAAIPLGGYVRMLDERDGAVPPEDLERSFTRKPPWQRILVLLAGPAANLLFAVAVLWGMFWVQGVQSVKPVVGDVTIDSRAANAGLRSE